VLLFTHREFTQEEIQFLDRWADCLLSRQLMRATTNLYNKEEMEDEEDWLKPCFPRFYFYDILRGLNFILKWASICGKPLAEASIAKVLQHLKSRFPDNHIRIERLSFRLTWRRCWIDQYEFRTL